MPIVINIRTEQLTREDLRIPPDLPNVSTELLLECFFCGNGSAEDSYGIACEDCAQSVFVFCEGCEEPTYIATTNRWENAGTFSERVATVHTGYGVGVGTTYSRSEGSWEPLPSPRSFLPMAFGLTEAPRVRVRSGDEPYSVTCAACVTDCPGCGAPFYSPESAEECCTNPFSCPQCEEGWGSEESARECCEGGLLRDYSFRPGLRFWSMDGCRPISNGRPVSRTLFMGMELELENARNGLERFLKDADESPNDMPSFLWTKADGSLHADGVELVTMPATFQAFRREFPWAALEAWRTSGARSFAHASCGLHIHVARSAFDPSHLWRFVKFQLLNAPLCQLVAQRAHSDYAQWSMDAEIEDGEEHNLPDVVKGKDSNRNRYVALNFQNEATVELRYFKGNALKDSILAKLGYVDSLYEWTKGLTVRDCASGALRSPRDYLAWVSDQDYPELIAFLTKRERIA